MRPAARHAIRRTVRVGAWPALRVARAVARWQRGQVYGIRPPRWWPERLEGWLGPRSPYDNKHVVIFVGSDRYEFVPATSGKYSGHVHHGVLRPDAADLAARLDRLGLPTDAARTLAAISEFEGGFDAIQTWDRGKFSWGFIQFTVIGGLPRLIQNLKALNPAAFADCFAPAGFDVDASGCLTLREGHRTLSGRALQNRLHDDPALWRWFLIASRSSAVQDAQVSTAYERYYAHPLNISVPIGADHVRLGDLFAHDEYGRAVVCDRAVNRGVGYTILLFRSAVRWAGARSVDDAPAVLEWVRAAEAVDAWRLDGLAQKLITTAG